MLTIDHTTIAPETLAIARSAAALDPDGQIYPWRDGYPLVGATVYWDGQLWNIVDKDGGAVLLLVGCGVDSDGMAEARDVRPVLWTQEDEQHLESATRAPTSEIDPAILAGLLASTEPPLEQLNERPEILAALVDSPANEAPASSLSYAPLFSDGGK
jgi:hypothetical protein